MKINYNKSELITLGPTEDEKSALARLFCCNIGDSSIKYLDVPLHFSKLKERGHLACG
jgi:hypothetical protein